jgi:DNA mismatch repair protein MutS
MGETAAKIKTADDFIADGHTPMMAQFMTIKEAHPDCLLFYRMGDFYELFFDDAVIAAEILDITLTKRGKTQENEIPMCGVPFHSYQPYLAKLIQAGHKVAICEQTETPDEAKKRGGYKALVNREVIRIVTQGTLTDDNLLDARENNYLASLVEVGGQYGIAWLQLSTGEFTVQPVLEKNLSTAIERVNANEILLPEGLLNKKNLHDVFSDKYDQITTQPNSLFDSQNAQKRLEKVFGVGTLDGFGGFSRAEIAAAGSLIDYVDRTQKGNIPHLACPKQVSEGAIMEIDSATRRNLELMRTLSGERKGSLLSAIDRTITGAGARKLQSRLSAPLTDVDSIHKRQNELKSFYDNSKLRELLREQLKQVPDMERAIARLTIGRGGPADLGQLRNGLSQAEVIRAVLLSVKEDAQALSVLIDSLHQNTNTQSFVDELKAALKDELPQFDRDGGFIREGYSKELDKLLMLRDESKKLIAGLQEKYRSDTDISTLKISYNNMLGYFVDVPAKRADLLMIRPGEETNQDNPFIHRQTLANNVRFTTVELTELERDISQASDKALAIEQALFKELVEKSSLLSDEIGKHARTLASLDVASSLAQLAVDNNYTCPVIDNSLSFDIKSGRHTVVEEALRKQSEAFVPNDCDLGPVQKLWLLTGPNMAGKSTFLRQNALIAILAQIGSFVPAESAHIGVIDRLFSRVGAADDLARGRSTFMVEMVETAGILNRATDRSLVILDEIGRGTATFDGLSIAWSCVEYLHEKNKCRALFATHYHELTSLQVSLPSLSCYSMQVKEWKGDIIFLHSVKEGSADHSYGIHVAKLAGLPSSVINRSKQVLDMLQKSEQSGSLTKLVDDLPLFSNISSQPDSDIVAVSEVEERLKALDIDGLSPREALDILYELKSLQN